MAGRGCDMAAGILWRPSPATVLLIVIHRPPTHSRALKGPQCEEDPPGSLLRLIKLCASAVSWADAGSCYMASQGSRKKPAPLDGTLLHAPEAERLAF